MRRLTLLLLLLITIMLGCSNDAEETTDRSEEEVEMNEKSQPADDADVYPLTGKVGTNDLDGRIISVMVNNHPDARPQSGIADADIVFEILAEGGITRLLALYQSEIPDVVGPVRSARDYYFKIADEYDALYVYHGAADFIGDKIVSQGIDFLNGAIYDNDGHLFKRESFRVAPHNSYFLMDAAYEIAESKGYDIAADYESLLFLNEEEVGAIGGEDLNQVDIMYNNSPSETVSYKYDEQAGNYQRYINDIETIDLNDEQKITVENLLIIETHHEIIDDVGRRAIDLDSGGSAYLLQKGILQEVEWKNDNGRIVPVKDGQVIGLVPGKTWINVVPSMDEYVNLSVAQ